MYEGHDAWSVVMGSPCWRAVERFIGTDWTAAGQAQQAAGGPEPEPEPEPEQEPEPEPEQEPEPEPEPALELAQGASAGAAARLQARHWLRLIARADEKRVQDATEEELEARAGEGCVRVVGHSEEDRARAVAEAQRRAQAFAAGGRPN